MGALSVTDRPTNVDPTETAKPRKTRSDKGQPRTRLSPEERAAQLNARAAVILADAKAKAEAKIRHKADALLLKAHGSLMQASALVGMVDAEKASALRDLAERVDGLELGTP